MTKLDDILAERGKRYGSFEDHSHLFIHLWGELEAEIILKREGQLLRDVVYNGLMMVCHKLARLPASPEYVDTWRDIAGYATLVADWLESQEDGQKQAEGSE